jgi:predicted nucleotidyltransferase component of viral defense system
MGKLPHTVHNLKRLIRFYAEEHRVYYQKVEIEVAKVVVSQMLPDFALIKGGSSLSLMYELTLTRYTKDLDLVIKEDFAKLKTKFEKNLKEGFSSFTGKIIVHDSATPDRTTMPKGAKMIPCDVRLSYKGKPFKTLRVEVVPDLNDEFSDARTLVINEGAKILRALNLEDPNKETLHISVEKQIAQKIHGLTRPGSTRGHDLMDIQRYLQEEFVDYKKLNDALIDVFERNDTHKYPPSFDSLSDAIRIGYEGLVDDYDDLQTFDNAVRLAKNAVDNAMIAIEINPFTSSQKNETKTHSHNNDSVTVSSHFKNGKRIRSYKRKKPNKS